MTLGSRAGEWDIETVSTEDITWSGFAVTKHVSWQQATKYPSQPEAEAGTGMHSAVGHFLTETVHHQRTVRLRGLAPGRDMES